jgi:hypothetical protein
MAQTHIEEPRVIQNEVHVVPPQSSTFVEVNQEHNTQIASSADTQRERKTKTQTGKGFFVALFGERA